MSVLYLQLVNKGRGLARNKQRKVTLFLIMCFSGRFICGFRGKCATLRDVLTLTFSGYETTFISSTQLGGLFP
jgi:hypothetical protein